MTARISPARVRILPELRARARGLATKPGLRQIEAASSLGGASTGCGYGVSMDLHVAGRTALVTGSSGGIGRAIATRLAREGCSVLVHGRDRGSADETAQSIRDLGGTATVLLGDLTVATQADAVAGQAAEHGVDILVANAGPYAEHDWSSAEPDGWRAAFEGNVISAVRLIRALTPPMAERGWGRVITIGTRGTITPLANMVEYSAAKAAVVNLTSSLAKELAGSKVTANCVSPGVILTPSLRRMFEERSGGAARWDQIEDEVTAEYAPNPVGRLGRPDDIADAVAFLAGACADYITGITLPVDGGITGTV